MRQRDLHILTSALHTYTNDWRISSIHTVVRDEDEPEDADQANASPYVKWSAKVNASSNGGPRPMTNAATADDEDGNWSEWTLRIRSAQVKDAGLYECQVSTEPKISRIYRLNVVGNVSIGWSSSLRPLFD